MAVTDFIVTSPNDFAQKLSARMILEMGEAFQKSGTCRIALTGGSAGAALFPELRQLEARVPDGNHSLIDWSRVEVFWADERAVSRTDDRSNYKQANELWLAQSKILPGNVHPMDPIPSELDACALRYEKLLRRPHKNQTSLDVVLLGVGPDGHICSLFPSHQLLKEEKRWVAGVSDSPKPPSERLTLTLPALFCAGTIIVAAEGEGKAAAILEGQSPESSSPLAKVMRGAHRVIVVLDEAAASRLPTPKS